MSGPHRARARSEPDNWRRAAFAAIAASHGASERVRGVVPCAPGANDIVTTVMRLDAPLLVDAMSSLSAEFPEHYWYPTSDLHVTVVGIRRDVDPGRLSIALAGEPCIAAEIRGLAMSRESIYARIYPDRGRIAALRRRVATTVGVPPRQVGLDLAHANIARFRRLDVAPLRRRVHALRGAHLGDVTFTSVLLARTDKVFATERTTVLAEFPLMSP